MEVFASRSSEPFGKRRTQRGSDADARAGLYRVGVPRGRVVGWSVLSEASGAPEEA